MKINKKLILIIGFRKCGTTSLYDYLVAQGVASPCRVKEPQLLGGVEVLDEVAIKNYLGLFDDEADCIIDGSTFLINDVDRIKEIINIFSDVKIFVCIRNPIKRFFSAYWHSAGKSIPEEKRSVDEVIDLLTKDGDSYNNELNYIKKKPEYYKYYDVNYLRGNVGLDFDFNPRNRWQAFQYYGEGLYSRQTKKLDAAKIKYHVVFFEHLIKERADCLNGVSDFLGFKLKESDFENISNVNKTYDRTNRGWIINIAKHLRLGDFISDKNKQRLKSHLFKSIPGTTNTQLEKINESYASEVQYWVDQSSTAKEFW